MKLEEFLEQVQRGCIPLEAPDGLSISRFEHNSHTSFWRARGECVKRGMWSIVTKTWASLLAEWIGDRKVLEIMAGPGWLAKALLDEGTRIIPTDDNSWSHKHSKVSFLLPIIQMDCIEAVKQYPEAQILLVSWPPYGEEAICNACAAWGSDRPIIYIGEGYGGCNAPEEFFDYFQEIETPPEIPFVSWPGLYDHIFIGYYRRNENAI